MTLESRTRRPETEQPQLAQAQRLISPTPHQQAQPLQPSPGVAALTSSEDQVSQHQRDAVRYEVFLEQIAHDLAYEDSLNPRQQAMLEQFGYSAEECVEGPHGFQMRVFTPGNAEFPHPILAFRGMEITSPKDVQTVLEPRSVGYNQFRANRRRIQQALERVGRWGRAWVTGHSLGGALAQLTAAAYSAQIARVVTFQAPGIDTLGVAELERFNQSNPEEAISSTHYQVQGDVVSSAGEALTPGEVVPFELKPSNGSTARTLTAGVLMGVLVGPTTGTASAAAMDTIGRHRAFPVSNAAQEHPAFQELFDEGKTFERVAGISKDTFEVRKPMPTSLFNASRVSNFLRHSVGRGVFAFENASSNWGGDAKAREWVVRNRDRIHTFTAAELLEHLNRLLDGWVSDDDVSAFETICFGVTDPRVMGEIRAAIQPRLEELHSDQQRRWIEEAINHQPKSEKK
jgi:pimeloyl-ACP methyl ester carboxylesterase